MEKEIKLITNTKHSTIPEQETKAKIRRNKNQKKLKKHNKESLKEPPCFYLQVKEIVTAEQAATGETRIEEGGGGRKIPNMTSGKFFIL